MACVAAVTILQGTRSRPFSASEVNLTAMKQVRGIVKINFPLQVGLTPSGEMQPVMASVTGIFWPKLIDIASDCHEQNIKMSRWQSKDTLIIQATRDIPVGQRLQLWFSEDLMMNELGIPPYLSPFNIRGGNSYVCHECHEQFERPNFLKLHLALHCDRLSSDTIWNRLTTAAMPSSPLLLNPSYLMALSPAPSSSGSPCPLFSLSPAATLPASLKINSISPPLLHQHNHHHQRHSQQLPRNGQNLQMPTLHLSGNGGLCGAPTISSSSDTSSTQSSPISPIIRRGAPVEGSTTQAAVSVPTTPPQAESNGRNSLVVQEQHHHHARLEAIVSNMGKAKNGHVCLYCGKLYSRKYGLKIHIRTHTGYKPLRCKVCHRPFGDPSNLNKHVRLHSDGTTPYRCELCSKVMVRKRDLDRHMRARHQHQENNGSSTPMTIRMNNGSTNLARQGCSTSSRDNRSSTVTSSMVSGGSSL